MAKSVEILLYEGMNELDFTGVYEVLTSVEVQAPGGRGAQKGFQVETVAGSVAPVETAHGMKVVPQKTLASSVGADVMIVPGGPGARRPVIAPSITEWLTRGIGSANLVAATSTGVYILGKAGLLVGRRVTTHYAMIEDLQRTYGRANVVSGVRVAVDGRNLMTSSGGSAALDLAFGIVERFYGQSVAQHAANRVEFPYQPLAGPG